MSLEPQGAVGRPKVFISEVIDFVGETHELLERHCDVEYGRPMWVDAGRAMTEDELIESCADVDVVMGSSRDRFTRRLFEACPRLQAVSKYGIGVDRIDVAAASELGVLVAHTPVAEDYESVAEHAVALALASVRRLAATEQHMRAGGWHGPDTVIDTLNGRTVGLIGLGRIGRAAAKRFAPFCGRVLAYDPHVAPEDVQGLGIECTSLDEVLRQCDVLSLHVTLSEETRSLIDERALGLMKPTAHIVNTSRGGVIDQVALADAVSNGRLAGAALDVFDPEPPAPGDPVLSSPRILVTPHMAGFAGVNEIAEAGARNALAVLAGELPPLLKNPEAESMWREKRRRPWLQAANVL